MKKNLELRLMANNEILATINAMLEFDNNNLYDDGQIFFQHPISGSMCENVKNILNGWLDNRSNLELLIDLIMNDNDLMQKAHDLNHIDYFIDLDQLVAAELSFIELDNIMIANNCYSVLDDNVINIIKQNKCVVYTSTITNECAYKINFEITIDSSIDEAEDNFYIRIASIENI